MWGGKQLSIALFSIVESVNLYDIWEPCPSIVRIHFPNSWVCGTNSFENQL